MKGDLHPSELRIATDEASGATLLQLTDHASLNHATYFLQSSLTPGGETLIFTSYRSGNAAQLYSVDGFPSGPIRQWTDGPPIHPFSPAIHPDGKLVVFVRGGSIWSIDVDTLDERLIVDFPGAQLGEVSLGAGGEWITAAAKQGSQAGIVAGRRDGTEWKLIPFPRTVIHPQFHPLEPDWIEFAGDPAPRMHRVRRDGSGMECLYQHSNEEFVVHETFLGTTGDLVYTVWPYALWRMNWTTRERRLICAFNAWHITPNHAGTAILCDTNHPDTGIYLIDTATGSHRKVCEPRATCQGSQWRQSRYALADDFARARSEFQQTGAVSWMEMAGDTVYGPQWSHPHPSFSPDERWVIFTSDRSGHPQVYATSIS